MARSSAKGSDQFRTGVLDVPTDLRHGGVEFSTFRWTNKPSRSCHVRRHGRTNAEDRRFSRTHHRLQSEHEPTSIQ